MRNRRKKNGLSDILGKSGFNPRSRNTVTELTNYLRSLILLGEIPTGTELSQVEIAEIFEISRTPVREALRTLSEQGLLKFEANYRAIVKGFDPEEMDILYADRIFTESLSASKTARKCDPTLVEELQKILCEMSEAGKQLNITRWMELHCDFHKLLASGAGDVLSEKVIKNFEHSQRFVYMYQRDLGGDDWWRRGEQEHIGLVDAYKNQDDQRASVLMAEHIGHTALELMAKLTPEYEPALTRTAIKTIKAAADQGVFGEKKKMRKIEKNVRLKSRAA